MERIWKGDAVPWTVFFVLVGVTRAAAGEPALVAWQTDVTSAWQATQQQGKPMLVFVTREDCFYCTQMKDRTWSNAAVAGAIGRSYVPLVLDGGMKSPLLAELNVKGYPVTFVISPQAVILERIEGFVPPEVLSGRLQALAPRPPMARLAKEP